MNNIDFIVGALVILTVFQLATFAFVFNIHRWIYEADIELDMIEEQLKHKMDK